MEANELVPYVEPIPEENSLVRRASSGEVDSFIQLFEAYGDDLYRYVYFRVLSDVAAEAITSQVFRHAWDHLGHARKKGRPFVAWLYELARNQVIVYYTANLRTREFNLNSLLTAADYRLDQQIPDWTERESWGNHLRLLTDDIEQSRLQATAGLIMRRYLDYLNPGSRSRPSPTFNSYTRAWLIRYVNFHPRGRNARITSAQQRPYFRPSLSMIGRMALTTAVLTLVLVATGTAQAQSALPGDPLYNWKRTSEQAILSVSPDPVGTELFLADRRLNELIQVKQDPHRSASALDGYYQALNALNTAQDAQARERIMPVLEAHRRKIATSGIASPVLDHLLAVAVTAIPAGEDLGPIISGTAPAAGSLSSDIPLPTGVPSTSAGSSGGGTISSGLAPTSLPPVWTPFPTDVPPTATAVPTDVPPTATPAPTDIPPTIAPTEVPPTIAPTDVPPTIAPTSSDTGATTTPAPADSAAPTDTVP